MLLLYDSWHILMRMRAPAEGSCDPIAPLELPHSLHAFHRVTEGDEHNVVTTCILYGTYSLFIMHFGHPREI